MALKGYGVNMNRTEQKKHNAKIIQIVERLVVHRYRIPSYKLVCNHLNESGLRSSVGNKWTERSLYRMLQRNSFSGLWGLLKPNQ